MSSTRLNSDILLEIVAYLDGPERLSLSYACRLGFHLSESPCYWDKMIPPAHFQRIADWDEYTGEEYRVAALRTKRVRDGWASASIKDYESTKVFSLNVVTRPSIPHSRRHLRIQGKTRNLHHIEGTQWLLDTSNIGYGKYTFIDINTGRECSTTFDRILYELAWGRGDPRFAVISPKEILLMRAIFTRSSSMGGYDMGADLLKVQFREGKDGNPPVTCTSLQLFRPEFTTYFDCDQEYAAVYSRRYQAFHPGEGKDVVMVYKVATGETWTWSLIRHARSLFIAGGYLFLILEYNKESHVEIVMEKLSALVARGAIDTEVKVEMVQGASGAFILRSSDPDLDQTTYPEISNPRNVFRVYIQEEERAGINPYRFDIVQVTSGYGETISEGRNLFRLVAGVDLVFLFEIKDDKDSTQMIGIEDICDAWDISQGDVARLDLSNRQALLEDMVLKRIIHGAGSGGNSTASATQDVETSLSTTILKPDKLGNGLIAYQGDEFTLDAFQLLDLTKETICRIPRVNLVPEHADERASNGKRNELTEGSTKNNEEDGGKGKIGEENIIHQGSMTISPSSKVFSVDMDAGFIILDVTEGQDDNKTRYLDVYLM